MPLALRQKIGYGCGHVLNDLTSAMWFSYLLLYFHKVLKFPNALAGVILLIGQVADALATPFVGLQADKGDDFSCCTRFGRRRMWHLTGVICVLLSFAFIFLGCLPCTWTTEDFARVIYFAPFVIIFQFGWACTQISHLAILPNLTADPHERTELNAFRYAATVSSTILVYIITWLVLDLSTDAGNSKLGPSDGNKFIIIAVSILFIGLIFSSIFYCLVKEPTNFSQLLSASAERDHVYMNWSDWLFEPQFYLVALLYMCTRLYCNLTQVYIPIYLQDSLDLQSQSIAYIPLVMYVSGFVTATAMKPVNRCAGRKVSFAFGCAFAAMGVLIIALSNTQAWIDYGVYPMAVLLGSGASTMLVTVLSLVADMIGTNVETSAFVYGSLSFTDKLSNGLAVMIIQAATPCPTCCLECKKYFKDTVSYAIGTCVLMSIVALFALVPVEIGRKRYAKEERRSLARSSGQTYGAISRNVEVFENQLPLTPSESDEENNSF